MLKDALIASNLLEPIIKNLFRGNGAPFEVGVEAILGSRWPLRNSRPSYYYFGLVSRGILSSKGKSTHYLKAGESSLDVLRESIKNLKRLRDIALSSHQSLDDQSFVAGIREKTEKFSKPELQELQDTKEALQSPEIIDKIINREYCSDEELEQLSRALPDILYSRVLEVIELWSGSSIPNFLVTTNEVRAQLQIPHNQEFADELEKLIKQQTAILEGAEQALTDDPKFFATLGYDHTPAMFGQRMPTNVPGTKSNTSNDGTTKRQTTADVVPRAQFLSTEPRFLPMLEIDKVEVPDGFLDFINGLKRHGDLQVRTDEQQNIYLDVDLLDTTVTTSFLCRNMHDAQILLISILEQADPNEIKELFGAFIVQDEEDIQKIIKVKERAPILGRIEFLKQYYFMYSTLIWATASTHSSGHLGLPNSLSLTKLDENIIGTNYQAIAEYATEKGLIYDGNQVDYQAVISFFKNKRLKRTLRDINPDQVCFLCVGETVWKVPYSIAVQQIEEIKKQGKLKPDVALLMPTNSENSFSLLATSKISTTTLYPYARAVEGQLNR